MRADCIILSFACYVKVNFNATVRRINDDRKGWMTVGTLETAWTARRLHAIRLQRQNLFSISGLRWLRVEITCCNVLIFTECVVAKRRVWHVQLLTLWFFCLLFTIIYVTSFTEWTLNEASEWLLQVNRCFIIFFFLSVCVHCCTRFLHPVLPAGSDQIKHFELPRINVFNNRNSNWYEYKPPTEK